MFKTTFLKLFKTPNNPSNKNTICEPMLSFMPKEIEIKCFENLIGQENLNI